MIAEPLKAECCLLLAVVWLGCQSADPRGAAESTPPPDGHTSTSADAAPPPGDAAAPPSDAGGSAVIGRDSGASGARDAATTQAEPRCAPRPVSGGPEMHFHHVHFNTTDPDADIEFFDQFLGAPPIEFCRDESARAVTRATRTERGYFLYSKVATAPDAALNTYLEHVGWIHPDPNQELLRLVNAGATLFPEGRAQCPEASAGQMACGFGGYWFYLQAPSGARIEVARGPGPAASGFGHVHMVMGVDFAWFATVTGDAYQDGAIDMVNHTAVALEEAVLAAEAVVETRGKPIDHLAYSTTDLESAKARIMAAGIAIEEDISFKPEFGFRSFFVKDSKGIWVEIVEDTPFSP